MTAIAPEAGLQPATFERSDRPTARAWYALGVIIAATLLGFVDRQVLILVADPLKHEMGLSDKQLGMLQGFGPGLFAAFGAIVLGWISDRTPRQLTLAACILAWSAATAASGLAANFPQMMLATVAIALGEAALAPVFFSMVPDLFPGKSRTTANLIFFGAVVFGAGFGFALGGGALGFVEAHRAWLPAAIRGLAAWRIAFFLVSVPGVPVSLAVAAIGSVRRTAPASAASKQSGSLRAYLRQHGRALGGVYVATSLCILGTGATGWLPIYIMRTLKASPSQAGVGLGVAVGGGALAGVILSGLAVRFLEKRIGRRAPLVAYWSAMLIAAPLMALQIVAQTPLEAYILLGFLLLVTTAGASLVPNMLQDISPAGLRGRILALWGMITSLGTAVAPVLVGVFSDMFAGQPHGLIWAIALVGAPALVAGVVVMRLTSGPFARTADALAPA